MSLSTTSIQRPVLTTVYMLVILLFGAIGYSYLGIREFPSVDPPVISVQTTYVGANADIIENQITEPLEQSINGIEGIRSLSSISRVGRSDITVEFQLSRDMEAAANDVRDKVSQALRYLPKDCDPPIVAKADADSDPILQLNLYSDQRNLLQLSGIADLTFKEQLQTISGVSSISIWGEKRYAMRLWMDPLKLSGYGLTPADVKSAILKENVELPSGSIDGSKVELTVRTKGLLITPEDFNNVIVSQKGGKVVRFKDLGRAELGPEEEKSIMRANGIPGVGITVIPQPGSNQIDIANEIYKRIELIKKDLPSDVRVEVSYDNTRFIRASINEVKDTIIEAFILVVFIIFFFLRDWRSTIIPTLVIPISLIGAFFIMYVAGFSINVLTLLAVVLSIGLVVDDAIVMMENIYVKVEQGESPREAGIKGANEIFFAIISTTVTLVAVFLPIVFLEGTTGRLFREFSLVISGAVLISAFVALTFTPMICTKILKHREVQPFLYRKTEPFFEKLNQTFRSSLDTFMRRKWLAWVLSLAALGLMYVFFTLIPSEMAPMEDRSLINVRYTAPEGTSYESMVDFTKNVEETIQKNTPELTSVMTRNMSTMNFTRVMLKPIKERTRSQQEIFAALNPKMRGMSKAKVMMMQQSTFGGRRSGQPIQYVLQAVNLEKLKEILPKFMNEVNKSDVFQNADVNLKFTKPEVHVTINRDKANLMGVSTENIAQTISLALSGQRMAYFYMNGKQYQIIGQFTRENRNKPLDLTSLYSRNAQGSMIQLDNVVDLKEESAPPQLYRYNRFVSATVSAGLAPGNTIGDGLEEMDKIAKKVLDETFRTALSGESKDFRESSSSLYFAFLLALVLIYLVLAAQFESFRDPLVIMFTVPMALLGALMFMWYKDVTMNIFSQIGIIMLIGLVTKNGILIVEFANQRRHEGIKKLEAATSATASRFRPILMTSFATVLGILPLTYASGEGANGRIAMGVAVVGGMVVATILSLYIVPAMYVLIAKKDEKE